ncbi:MAG TPA: hypothetical protein VLW26_07970 [Steroidobacteraceae bacterium]|nr:hypothetical protein [Steroidobacteraceae bacterium]
MQLRTFCSNPDCGLHVRVVDDDTNWASLADGRMFGRSRSGDRMYCDACCTQRGPVRLQEDQSRLIVLR